MCKYCNIKAGNLESIGKTVNIPVTIGKRTMYPYQMDAFIKHKPDDTFEMSMALWVDCEGDMAGEKSIRIKYCPFCGRDLRKKK